MASNSEPQAAPAPITAQWANEQPEIPAQLQEILTKYSGFPADETVSHVNAVLHKNDGKEFDSDIFPRTAFYASLTFSMVHHRLYSTHILPTLQKPLPTPPNSINSAPLPSPLYLELGTCYGHEMRTLRHQGVPYERLFGADINVRAIIKGYELFQDEEKLPPTQFIAPVDLLDPESFKPEGKLGNFVGKVDILSLVCVFHLWDWETQIQAARNCLLLMKEGGVIVGCQRGAVTAESLSTTDGGEVLQHSKKSWEDMWLYFVGEEGVVTDPAAHTKGARLGVYSEVIEFEKGTMPEGLNTYKTISMPEGADWLVDEDFRWMRFEVWVGGDPPSGLVRDTITFSKDE